VQALALAAREGRGGFRELVLQSAELREAVGEQALARAFELEEYLAHIDDTFRRLGLPLDPVPPAAVAERPSLAVEAGIGGGAVR
jgi:hypothetical protein